MCTYFDVVTFLYKYFFHRSLTTIFESSCCEFSINIRVFLGQPVRFFPVAQIFFWYFVLIHLLQTFFWYSVFLVLF